MDKEGEDEGRFLRKLDCRCGTSGGNMEDGLVGGLEGVMIGGTGEGIPDFADGTIVGCIGSSTGERCGPAPLRPTERKGASANIDDAGGAEEPSTGCSTEMTSHARQVSGHI
mmetsp:Transcript_26052/g.51935  ORF Transcript_26052/g.51935 Transcript_26052/m.51935 type:complete len:112 (+) Transcript_26052:456-791(+)